MEKRIQIEDSDNAEEHSSRNHTLASTPSSSTSGCVSGDDTSDGKSVPTSLITAENYLSISEESLKICSVDDLKKAIEQCKEMVLDSAECSEERKWLVRRLIEMRLRLQQVIEAEEHESDILAQELEPRFLLGHRFILQKQSAGTKHHCDRCSGVIWSVLHSWYQCSDCLYSCHVKCLSQVCRICAHVTASESPLYLLDICPEVGLSAQAYRCSECKAHITFTFPKGLSCFGRPFSSENSWVEPKLCDYNGLYYCSNCHWNMTAVIPARVIHNWDFEERPVCQASRQLLELMLKRPVLKLEELNPRLFGFVEELSLVKKLREDILLMKKYFVLCQDATDSKLLWQLNDRQHFVDGTEAYSLQDLIDINSGKLLDYLEEVQMIFIKHIKEDCKLCYGRGYVCELCDDCDVIFPFDPIAYMCPKCSTVIHKNCWTKKNHHCPKCARIQERAAKRKERSSSEEEEG